MPKTVYALLPTLDGSLGHGVPYHLAAQKAFESIGWCYYPFIPRHLPIKPPPGWQAKLIRNHSTQMLSKALSLLNAFPFRKLLRSLKTKGPSVLFLESFTFFHLLALRLALLGLKTPCQLWLLFRYDLPASSYKTFLLRHLFRFFENKLGPHRFYCLTDSKPLALHLSTSFQRPFHVVPIPHVPTRTQSVCSPKQPFLFWWAGGSAREEKGLSCIQKMVPLLSAHPKVQIAMTERAKPFIQESSQVLFLSDLHSSKDYFSWMRKAGLILLPYSLDYRYRTSGIFVEAICAGALPIVTQGTWMTFELQRFDLSELCFDWNESRLIETLCSISLDAQIEKKRKKMQKDYITFHCEKNFAKICESFSVSC